MIELKGVIKKFDGTVVLDGVNSTIKKGSIYGLLGTNGAGKSTLLNLIDGIYESDGGEVLTFGQQVFEDTKAKRKIAYIPDEPFFFSGYSMLDMAKYYDSAVEMFSMEKFRQIMTAFPLDEKKPIGTFSKGMKRQASIIFALSQNPEILLCDECFDGLDPVIKKLVKRLIINEVSEREMTAVISSHNLTEIENLCDTIGILHEGKIVIEKSMDDCLETLQKYRLAINPMPSAEEICTLDFEVLKFDSLGNTAEIIVRADKETAYTELLKLKPIFMENVPLNLEEIFICEMEAIGYDFSKILL